MRYVCANLVVESPLLFLTNLQLPSSFPALYNHELTTSCKSAIGRIALFLFFPFIVFVLNSVDVVFVNYAGVRTRVPAVVGQTLLDAAKNVKYEFIDGEGANLYFQEMQLTDPVVPAGLVCSCVWRWWKTSGSPA